MASSAHHKHSRLRDDFLPKHAPSLENGGWYSFVQGFSNSVPDVPEIWEKRGSNLPTKTISTFHNGTLDTLMKVNPTADNVDRDLWASDIITQNTAQEKAEASVEAISFMSRKKMLRQTLKSCPFLWIPQTQVELDIW